MLREVSFKNRAIRKCRRVLVKLSKARKGGTSRKKKKMLNKDICSNRFNSSGLKINERLCSDAGPSLNWPKRRKTNSRREKQMKFNF
jgi:hypothetical protein